MMDTQTLTRREAHMDLFRRLLFVPARAAVTATLAVFLATGTVAAWGQPTATPTPTASLDTPIPLGPADGSVFLFDQIQLDGGILLTWSPVTGTTFYRLVIDGPPTFPDVERAVFVPDPYRLMEPILLSVGDYTWTVQAYQSGEVYGPVSAPMHFSVRLPVQPTATPIVANPDVDRDDKVDLLDLFLIASSWRNSFTDPDYVDNADVFPDGVIDEKDMAFFATAWRDAHHWTPTPFVFNPPEPVYPEANAYFTLLEFNNQGAGTAFAWNPVDDPAVARYELLIDPPRTTLDIIYPASATTYAVTVTIAGQYAWRVRAVNADGVGGTWSPRRLFTVGFIPATPTPTPPGQPTPTPPPFDGPGLIWPPDGAQVSFLQLANQDLEWATLPGIADYELALVPSNPSNPFRHPPSAPLRIEGKTGYRFLFTFPDTYTWQVRGVDGDGIAGGWSAARTFTAG